MMRGRVRRAALGVTAVFMSAALGSGCAPPPAPVGPNPDLAPAASEARYIERGPYAAGVTTLVVGGRKVEVVYPADAKFATGATEVADARDALPPSMRAALTPSVDLTWDTGAHRGAPVAGEGPFPVVLSIHGFFLWRQVQMTLASHLASWGMIVALPDFPEFGVGAVDAGLGAPDTDAVLDSVVAALRAENLATGPGHVLSGAVDVTRLATIGHSFGSLAATGYAAHRPAVRAWVPLAAGSVPWLLFPTVDAGGTSKASMWIASSDDVTGAGGNVSTAAAGTIGPRAVVVMPAGGHSGAYTDLCLMGGTGLIAQLGKAGVSLPNAAQLASGCSASGPNRQAIDVVRHFVTATLRRALGLDPEPVGLGSGVAGNLPLPVTYTHLP